MTTKILRGYAALLLAAIVFALIGMTFAYASEVTGTLSSDTSAGSLNSGTLAGAVTSGGGSGSGGGNNRNSPNFPPGAVLGASTSNVSAPSFPNAGFAPTEE